MAEDLLGGVVFGSGIAKGMRITGRRLLMRSVNELYPYKRKTLPERSRTLLAMRAGDDGTPLCRACMTCSSNCPNQVLTVVRDAEDNRKVDTFSVDIGGCTFCGLCVEGCPSSGLHFTGDFERAVYDRRDLVLTLVRDGKIVAGESDTEVADA